MFANKPTSAFWFSPEVKDGLAFLNRHQAAALKAIAQMNTNTKMASDIFGLFI